MISNQQKMCLCAATSAVLLAVSTPSHTAPTHDPDRSLYRAPLAGEAPQVDGIANDAAWQQAAWREIDHRWLGPKISATDFTGRYKLVWTEKKLYLLTEIVDDVLIDTHRDPLDRYWDDDTLEVFIDEDHSGGNHQYNHNAFAYHLSLDNQAIDIGTDQQPHFYTHHVQSVWRQQGDKIIWEVSFDIYSDAYRDGAADNAPVALSAGKVMGLLVAYCDNDGSELRENFMGSEDAPGPAKDRGWIDAGLFGTLELID